LVLATVIPFTALIGAGLWSQWRSDQAAAIERALSEARVVAAQVDDHIGNLENLLAGLSQAVSTNSANTIANDAVLRQTKAKLPDFITNILLFSLDGINIGSSAAEVGRPYGGDRGYFRQVLAGERLSVSEVIRGRLTGRWIITVAAPVEDHEGRLRAVLAIGTRLDRLQDALRLQGLPVGSVVRIINENSIVVAQSLNGPDWIGRNLTDSEPVARHLAAKEANEVAVWSDNVERITGSSTAHRVPWLVSVGLPTDIAFAKIISRLSWSSLSIAAALLAAFVIAWTLSGHIVRPLRQLGIDASALATGVLSHRSTVRTQDEVGVLAEHFNCMAMSLERREEELRKTKDTLAAVIDACPVAIACSDADHRIVLWSRAAERIFGYTEQEVMGQRGKIIPPPELTESKMMFRRALGGETVRDIETKRMRKDGSLVDVRIAYAPMYDPDGTVSGVARAYEDITERRRLELERDRSQKFLNTIIENVPAPIFVKEASGLRYVLVNQAAENFLGLSRTKMIGKTSYEVFAKEEADLIAARNEQLLQSDQPIFDEREIRTPCNGIRTIVSKRLVVSDDDGKSRYVVGVIEDVTERKRAEDRIAHLAHYDALTNLPNRVHFAAQLEHALTRVRRGDRLAVLYIDLDHFKRVNDTLGHAIGDELLKGVADRLRGCVREIDSIARLSGDEFAVIQTSIDRPSDAAALAMRICEAIKAPYNFNGHHAVVDSSIGICIAPNDSTEPDELLKAADMALYEAKTSSRGTYCFYEPEMDARLKARSELEFDLRKALGSGEFELLYQPIVNLQNNRITSCEALLRWHHPERGVISPAEFMPIAEEIGIITQLGEWVLRTACAEAATWPDEIHVAVNVSPTQLTSNNTMQVVINALAASGVPAHRLELEITESVFMRNTFATLATLHQLHELGVRIAMDDFGTGYSSLSYLLSFPFNKIKIDRCFIKGLMEGDNSRAIVRAVANLAASLGMITTAEGVETEQQLDQTRLLGCTEMQGYLFSPARPAAEIFQLLLSQVDRAESAA
jgi:diguanylate cyclase (GGDEF)-like protein/PAS domain S-box-containing protein